MTYHDFARITGDAPAPPEGPSTFSTVFEDFEGGTGFGQVNAQTSVVFEGTYSGRFNTAGIDTATTSIAFDTYSQVGLYIRVSAYGSDGRPCAFQFRDSEDDEFFDIAISDDGSIFFDNINGTDSGADVELDKWYEFWFSNIDYGAQTYDVTVTREEDQTVILSESGRSFRNPNCDGVTEFFTSNFTNADVYYDYIAAEL